MDNYNSIGEIILDHIPNQIWFFTDEETYGGANKAHASFLGMTAEELKNQRLYSLFSQELTEVIVATNKVVYATKEPITTQEWLRDVSGRRRLLLVNRTPVLDSKGKVRYVVCVAEDITERKKAEEVLQSRTKRYQAIVEGQTELVCCFKPDGRLTFANQAYCDYYRKSKRELVGSNLMLLIPNEDRVIIKKKLESLCLARSVATYRHRAILGDGSIRWQQWTSGLITDWRGSIVEIHAVGRDITQEIAFEEANRHFLNKLEEKYQQRTRQYEEALVRLRQAQDEAQRNLEKLRRLSQGSVSAISKMVKLQKPSQKKWGYLMKLWNVLSLQPCCMTLGKCLFLLGCSINLAS